MTKIHKIPAYQKKVGRKRTVATIDRPLVQTIKQFKVNPKVINEYGVGGQAHFFRAVASSFPRFRIYRYIDPNKDMKAMFEEAIAEKKEPIEKQLQKVKFIFENYESASRLSADLILSHYNAYWIPAIPAVLTKIILDLNIGGIAILREMLGTFEDVDFPLSTINHLRKYGVNFSFLAHEETGLKKINKITYDFIRRNSLLTIDIVIQLKNIITDKQRMELVEYLRK